MVSGGLSFPICPVGEGKRERLGGSLTVETSWMWEEGFWGHEVKPKGHGEASRQGREEAFLAVWAR